MPARSHASDRGSCKEGRHSGKICGMQTGRGDALILEQLKLDENEKELLEHIVKQMEQERGLDRSAAIADMRFTFIEKICDATVVKPKESKEHLRSAKMDKILTGKYTAIPCFIAIMAAVFWLTFNVIGAFLSESSGYGNLCTYESGRWRCHPGMSMT